MKDNKKAAKIVFTVTLLICGWMLLAYMGYQQAYSTLDDSIKEVKLEHTLQIKEIEAQIITANEETVALRAKIDLLNSEIRQFNDGLDNMVNQLEIIDTNIIDSELLQLEISTY